MPFCPACGKRTSAGISAQAARGHAAAGRQYSAREDVHVIVTISREYGAGGLAVSQRTAQILGYDLLRDELPNIVAKRLGTSAEDVASRADTGATLGERILASLDAGTPQSLATAAQTDLDESVRREIERSIRERAEVGDVVILGRYGSAILGPRSDAVRAFLVAPQGWRAARLAESFDWDTKAALGQIERIDASRRRLAKERYDLQWGDPHAYDLVIDVSRITIDGAAALIASAVRTLEAGTQSL